jgi:hypothetical protein
VWELDLPRPEKFVALALADHGKDDGTCIYPSLGRIEWKTGYSRTQVRQIMQSLVKMRLLFLVRKGGAGRGDCDEYRMEVCNIVSLPDFRLRNKGAETAPMPSASAVNIDDKVAKGTETAPIYKDGFPQKGAESDPIGCDKGAVPVDKGYGFDPEKGPETAPESKPNLKPRTKPSTSAVADADPRHDPIRKILITGYAKLNDMAEPLVEWDGREGKALKAWLADHPKVTVEDAERCAGNFFRSDGPVTQRLAKTIPSLMEYFACELNQFGTPRVLDRKHIEDQRRRSGAAVGSQRSYA